jgi:hypothetical protein
MATKVSKLMAQDAKSEPKAPKADIAADKKLMRKPKAKKADYIQDSFLGLGLQGKKKLG